MDLNSFPGHLLQEDFFSGLCTSLSPPHLKDHLFYSGEGLDSGEVACMNFFVYAAFDFGFPCTIASVPAGPQYAISLVKC